MAKKAPSKENISLEIRYLSTWNEINCRMQMRDRAVWNYVAGAAALLGVSLANGAENAWLGLFVPWIAFVSVILFAFHDSYIASQVQFLTQLSSRNEQNPDDWFSSEFGLNSFKRQHWLLFAQFVALFIPCVVAMVLTGWHLSLLIDGDSILLLAYLLVYLADWIVVITTLAIVIWTWQSHSTKISGMKSQ